MTFPGCANGLNASRGGFRILLQGILPWSILADKQRVVLLSPRSSCPGPDDKGFEVYAPLALLLAGVHRATTRQLQSSSCAIHPIWGSDYVPADSDIGTPIVKDARFRQNFTDTDLYNLGKKPTAVASDGPPAFPPQQTRQIQVSQSRKRINVDLMCVQWSEVFTALIPIRQAAWFLSLIHI